MQPHSKTVYLFLICLLFISYASAQEEQDTLKKKSKVIVVERKSKIITDTEDKKKRVLEEEKQEPYESLVLKTSLFRVFNGELPLLAEFELKKRLSLEIGPSITFKDFMSQQWFDKSYPLSRGRAIPGLGFTSMLKIFHRKEDNLNGAFIGLYGILRRHRFNYAVHEISILPSIVNIKELGFVYGIQHNENSFHEFNIGIGVRHYTLDRLVENATGLAGPGGIKYVVVRQKQFIPALFLAYKFGGDLGKPRD